jgi:hypothetical protein
VFRVHGVPGSERVLVQNLRKRGIKGIDSLSDVEWHIAESDGIIARKEEQTRQVIRREIEYLRMKREEKISEQTRLRRERVAELEEEHSRLAEEVSTPPEPTRNPFLWIYRRVSRYLKNRRKTRIEDHFLEEVTLPFRHLFTEISRLKKQADHLEANIEAEMRRRLAPDYRRKKQVDAALSRSKLWITGARGEHRTLKVLRELPDDYVVFNDVTVRPSQPVTYGDAQKSSCEADHIVIGPTGVFNIESKNWGEGSIERPDLRSPVTQVILSGKALYWVVNAEVREGRIPLARHHWGHREIRVRNVLSMTRAMPNVQFQYVRMVPVDQLGEHIMHCDARLGQEDVEAVERWFLERGRMKH